MRRPARSGVVVAIGLTASLSFGAGPASGAKPVWSIMPFPSPTAATTVDFEDVACVTAASCFAVGFSQAGNVRRPLIERWNGSKWSVVAAPNPAGSTNASLQAVSCPAATSCFAVGIFLDGATNKSLIEHWDGTAWSVMNSPNPVDLAKPLLESVSCANPTSCMAVGQPRVTTGEGIVEHWDGSTWSLMTLAKLPGWVETSLAGVSCPAADSCFGVGFFAPVAEAPLAALTEHWDGSAWSVVANPSPTGAIPAVLGEVSCPTTTSCYAVGTYSPPTRRATKTLIERWNGVSWSIVASPNPASGRSVLSDVSCPSATNCTAVGQYVQVLTPRTLVERWNGTSWSLTTSPNPSGSDNSWLRGVSCPTATRCFAVGTSRIKLSRGLIERFA